MEQNLLRFCSVIIALWGRSGGPKGLCPHRSDRRARVVVKSDLVERNVVSSTGEAVGVVGVIGALRDVIHLQYAAKGPIKGLPEA